MSVYPSVRRDALDNPTCQRSNSPTWLYARSDVSIVRHDAGLSFCYVHCSDAAIVVVFVDCFYIALSSRFTALHVP